MEIPTCHSITDDCLKIAGALYNARHDTPRMAALACLLTSGLGVVTFGVCMEAVVQEWLSSVVFFLNLGQLLLCLLMVAAEAPRVLPIYSGEECLEGRFGFLTNAFSRAVVYFYLGLSCIPLVWLSVLCYITAPLLLAAGVVTIIFRRRQIPPEGEILPSF